MESFNTKNALNNVYTWSQSFFIKENFLKMGCTNCKGLIPGLVKEPERKKRRSRSNRRKEGRGESHGANTSAGVARRDKYSQDESQLSKSDSHTDSDSSDMISEQERQRRDRYRDHKRQSRSMRRNRRGKRHRHHRRASNFHSEISGGNLSHESQDKTSDYPRRKDNYKSRRGRHNRRAHHKNQNDQYYSSDYSDYSSEKRYRSRNVNKNDDNKPDHLEEKDSRRRKQRRHQRNRLQRRRDGEYQSSQSYNSQERSSSLQQRHHRQRKKKVRSPFYKNSAIFCGEGQNVLISPQMQQQIQKAANRQSYLDQQMQAEKLDHRYNKYLIESERRNEQRQQYALDMIRQNNLAKTQKISNQLSEYPKELLQNHEIVFPPNLQFNQNFPQTNSYRNLFQQSQRLSKSKEERKKKNKGGFNSSFDPSMMSKSRPSLSSYVSKSPKLGVVQAIRRAEESSVSELTTMRGDYNKYLFREPQIQKNYKNLNPKVVQNAIKNCVQTNPVNGESQDQRQQFFDTNNEPDLNEQYFVLDNAQNSQNIDYQVNHEELDFEIVSKAATAINPPIYDDELYQIIPLTQEQQQELQTPSSDQTNGPERRQQALAEEKKQEKSMSPRSVNGKSQFETLNSNSKDSSKANHLNTAIQIAAAGALNQQAQLQPFSRSSPLRQIEQFTPQGISSTPQSAAQLGQIIKKSLKDPDHASRHKSQHLMQASKQLDELKNSQTSSFNQQSQQNQLLQAKVEQRNKFLTKKMPFDIQPSSKKGLNEFLPSDKVNIQIQKKPQEERSAACQGQEEEINYDINEQVQALDSKQSKDGVFKKQVSSANALKSIQSSFKNKDRYFKKSQIGYYQEEYPKTLKKSSNSKFGVKNFQLGEQIGHGSFGDVYQGYERETGRQVAVKRVPFLYLGQDAKKQDSKITALQTEVELLKKLNHENIVKYLGTKREHNNLCVLLEYCPDGTLESHYKNFPMNENIVSLYTRQILLGLEYLHYHEVIHRDIKSANILLRNNGPKGMTLQLADFGSSKKICEGEGDKMGSFIGTPYWMAPEVVRQTGHNRFADIWSLGCTVYELATGRPPWYEEKAQVMKVFNRICNTKKPPKYPKCSQELKDFLDCCFQVDPAKRANVYELLNHPFITKQTLATPLAHLQVQDEESHNDEEKKFDSQSLVTISEALSMQQAALNANSAANRKSYQKFNSKDPSKEQLSEQSPINKKQAQRMLTHSQTSPNTTPTISNQDNQERQFSTHDDALCSPKNMPINESQDTSVIFCGKNDQARLKVEQYLTKKQKSQCLEKIIEQIATPSDKAAQDTLSDVRKQTNNRERDYDKLSMALDCLKDKPSSDQISSQKMTHNSVSEQTPTNQTNQKVQVEQDPKLLNLGYHNNLRLPKNEVVLIGGQVMSFGDGSQNSDRQFKQFQGLHQQQKIGSSTDKLSYDSPMNNTQQQNQVSKKKVEVPSTFKQCNSMQISEICTEQESKKSQIEQDLPCNPKNVVSSHPLEKQSKKSEDIYNSTYLRAALNQAEQENEDRKKMINLKDVNMHNMEIKVKDVDVLTKSSQERQREGKSSESASGSSASQSYHSPRIDSDELQQLESKDFHISNYD